jgi:pilus assembly protein CpaB
MATRAIMVVLMFATAVSLGMIAYQLGRGPVSAPVPVVQAIAPPVPVPYLVAARPLSPGTLARTEDFSPRNATAGTVPPDAIIDTPDARAELRSSLIRRYIEAGVPITRGDIMRPHERGFLAAVLAPDTRAVSIAVNPVSGVAGLISPGDRVDVILTQEIQQSGGHVPHIVTSETVLTNVRVLAVDQEIAQGAPTNVFPNAAHTATTVTVQTSVDQAERIAVATHLGILSLAVRSIEDEGAPERQPGMAVSSGDVSQALARANVSDGSHVEVIQGGQRSEVTFK